MELPAEIYMFANPGYGWARPQSKGGRISDEYWEMPKAKRNYYGVNLALERDSATTGRVALTIPGPESKGTMAVWPVLMKKAVCLPMLSAISIIGSCPTKLMAQSSMDHYHMIELTISKPMVLMLPLV